MTNILKQFVDTANARADADNFKAGAKLMAEHFDAETGRLNLRISTLTDALRKVAVFHRYRPAEGGGTVFMGAGCEICDAECGPEQQIVHVGDCPLTVLNLQQ